MSHSNSPRTSHTQAPLHQLAELTPQDIRISLSKLITFYETHGQFPSPYRSLIWRYLLKLPENIDEFGILVRKGPHSAFESTSTSTSNSNTTLFDLKSRDRSKAICSLLAHWSPVLVEVSNIIMIL
jgi:hypothetical protein